MPSTALCGCIKTCSRSTLLTSTDVKSMLKSRDCCLNISDSSTTRTDLLQNCQSGCAVEQAHQMQGLQVEGPQKGAAHSQRRRCHEASLGVALAAAVGSLKVAVHSLWPGHTGKQAEAAGTHPAGPFAGHTCPLCWEVQHIRSAAHLQTDPAPSQAFTAQTCKSTQNALKLYCVAATP